MGWATEHGPRRCQFVALERSRFRKNRSIKLILITRLLRRIVCGTNKLSRSELEHGQTDKQTNPTSVTLAAHARRGLIMCGSAASGVVSFTVISYRRFLY